MTTATESPQEPLVEVVDQLAAKGLMSRTSWVTRALLSACEVDGEEESLEDRLAALEQQLDTRIAQKLAEADRVVGAGR